MVSAIQYYQERFGSEKKKDSEITPMVPPTPQPGVFTSKINPRNPRVINIPNMIGLEKKSKMISEFVSL